MAHFGLSNWAKMGISGLHGPALDDKSYYLPVLDHKNGFLAEEDPNKLHWGHFGRF